MSTKTLLTLEQFDQLPVMEGVRYELDEGELLTLTEPMPRHNLVRDNIAAVLRGFVLPRKLGRVFTETGYQLSPETVRIPDVSFVPAERMREIDLDRRIPGAPALAVEVVSPTDLAQDLAQKVDQYLAAGVRAVWVVYPNTSEVHVFRGGGASSVLGAADQLEAPDLLPGFAVLVSRLFEEA
jgi:Uma2 family endonuclease